MSLVFLNERSCGTACDPGKAERAMAELTRAIAAVAQADRSGTVLVTEVPLLQVQIADDYPITKWMNSPRYRDHGLRLRRIASKAPFKVVLPDGEDPMDVEYRHESLVVRGLGGAHLMDGLGVSLPVHARWDTSALRLEREQLIALADGSPETEVTDVEVRHLSTEEHLGAHLAWLREPPRVTASTGAALWDRRAELFPHVQFLDRVEEDLRELPQVWVWPVARRLAELEAAVAEWDPADQPDGPRWRSWVTGEHEQRKRLCWFTDLDGQPSLFDTHCRFTPGPGRLYFRVVDEERAVRIAYLGRKLGI